MMSQTFIRYYLFKDATKYISPSIKNNLELNPHELFKYALFKDASLFYHLFHPFKVDSYQISKRIFSENFNSFFMETIENAYLHASHEEMLFCYFLLYSHIVQSFFTPYVEALITRKKNKSYVEKMLESYFFCKREGFLITKINIADYFFDAFQLSDSDIHLIEKPIKRELGFFSIKNYFSACYKSASNYYNHLCRSRFGFKTLLYFSYDALLNHRKGKTKAKNFIYHKKIDTTVLNLTHQEFMIGTTIYKDNVDELYERTLKVIKTGTNHLNDYFNFNQNKKGLENFLATMSIDKKE